MEEKISKGETENIMLFRENWMILRKDNQIIVRRKRYITRCFLIGNDLCCACSWNRNCRYSSTAGYSKRESPGRKATDGANAEGKYS